MVDATQIQTAAIVFPVIVLITNFAINSVTNEDGTHYRVFVGGMGLLALLTAMIASMLLFIGGLSDDATPMAYSYLVVSAITIFFLSLGIIAHEISRGLTSESEKVYVTVGVTGFIALAVIVLETV